MKISLIFSTYNSPKWLEKVLWGCVYQTDKNFEVVIADDGSNEETKHVVDYFINHTELNIQHIWHEDDGFQKCKILNKAILAAEGEYLIFTDGDCIPRKDFIEVHRHYSEPGYFLSGGYTKLPMSTSESITTGNIELGDCFNKNWLQRNGYSRDLNANIKLMKLTAGPTSSKILNSLTPTKPTWNGHNASCWKKDALIVNGYDSRLRYGGLDREFGERLIISGLKTKQIRYSAICIHLDHPRGYANAEGWKLNRSIRANNIKNKIYKTEFGIEQPSN